MRPLAPMVAAALLSAGLARSARADIYRWTDADGHAHFTQDLAQVPAPYRGEAELSARKEQPRSAAAPTTALTRASGRTRAGGAIEIPFEKQGNAMVVYARINDAVTAPFIVDTGASDVVLPRHVARAAGVRVAADGPRERYQTANGLIDSPVVTIDSVALGDARVEGVRGSLSDAMSVGLLGGTFFNHFTMQIDPAASVITLRANAGVRGGANGQEWRERFRALRSEIAAIDAHTSGGQLLDDGRVAELARVRAARVAELEALEAEANAADVPQAWRE